MFAPARQMGVRGKKKSGKVFKGRKSNYLIELRFDSGNRRIKLTSDEHPTHLLLPYLNMPTIIPQDKRAIHTRGLWLGKYTPAVTL